MGVVGVGSITWRAVKCFDPCKTTSGESGRLGYTPGDCVMHSIDRVGSLIAVK